MKKTHIRMIAVFLVLASFACCFASCSKKKSNLPNELYSSFSFKIDSGTAKEYLVHFLKEGVSVSSAYTSSENGYITYRSDAHGNLTIDLNDEFDNFSKIMKKSSNIKIAVSATDDPFIRNPLNDACIIRLYVVEGENKQPVIMCKETSVSTSISAGKEGNGISLAFPNASFIIKLDPSESGIETIDDTKFEVFLYDNSDTSSKTRIGRVCRGFNYWEAPFYKNEIASKTFTLVIKPFSEDKTISYEGAPMTFSFNEQGLCSLGSVVRVKITEKSDQIHYTERQSETTTASETDANGAYI